MSNGTVPAVYSFVILDVIQKMQPRFAELGIDDQTLLQLQKNWELKIRTLQIAPFTSNLGVGGLRNEFEFNAVLNGAFHSPVLIHKNVPQNDGVDLDAGIDSNAESLDASLQMAADLSTEAAAGIPLHASTAKKGGNRPGKRVVQFDGLEDDEDDEADDDVLQSKPRKTTPTQSTQTSTTPTLNQRAWTPIT